MRKLNINVFLETNSIFKSFYIKGRSESTPVELLSEIFNFLYLLLVQEQGLIQTKNDSGYQFSGQKFLRLNSIFFTSLY